MMTKIWASFVTNFGGEPYNSKIDDISSHKILLFTFLLDGMISWIFYRAFLTSKLSTKLNKYPFTDLNSLAETDYK